MLSIFPIRSSGTLSPPDGARVIAIEDESAGDVIAALSSLTARQILIRVYDEPCTPSDLADATDTSLQNIRYHLDNLLEADLVEVVDTWYSATGNEMQVYAPTAAALVMIAGIDTTTSEFETMLKQALGAVGILAVGSTLVQLAAQALRPARDNMAGGGAGGGASRGAGQVATSVIDTLPPGLLFFAGGLLLLVVYVGWWYYRPSRSK